MRYACQLPNGGSAPATLGFNAVAPEWLCYGAAEAAPAFPAPESTLGSHPCVALSSAQVLPEWTTTIPPRNDLSANGDYPLNFLSHSKGSLQSVQYSSLSLFGVHFQNTHFCSILWPNRQPALCVGVCFQLPKSFVFGKVKTEVQEICSTQQAPANGLTGTDPSIRGSRIIPPRHAGGWRRRCLSIVRSNGSDTPRRSNLRRCLRVAGGPRVHRSLRAQSPGRPVESR